MSYLVFRNVAIPVNGIILTVVGLLILFGNGQEGIFLGITIGINMLLGIVQDVSAWLALERLESITALQFIRVNTAGVDEKVSRDALVPGDTIRLQLGDQVPCDGVIVASNNLELSEALITGESESHPGMTADQVLAGSVVTAGSGVVRVATVYRESRIARMTESIRRYSVNVSPIQQSIAVVIRYSTYSLIACSAFISFRGYVIGTPRVDMVEQIGAIAGTLVPQGLLIATTLLFTYGALRLHKRNVLLQELNAAEKLGCIQNLCMDKTGTLTERALSVDSIDVSSTSTRERARALISTYAQSSEDSSETVKAIRSYLHDEPPRAVLESVTFSSWRMYGAVLTSYEQQRVAVIAGAPEVIMPHVSEVDRAWLAQTVAAYTVAGKHVLCFAQMQSVQIPQSLDGARLACIGIIVLHNTMRPGIQAAIDFFQERGVLIRILSGDNPGTVRAVATAAGVANTDAVITGEEMTAWDQQTYDSRASGYTIFARIRPEQKEHIVIALKKNGFTAMVGDGANDALAVKKADLGIAMFDGAAATRQIAGVVLTTNSFTELPGAVVMADNIIGNAELFASIFFNQTAIGLFFFALLAMFGYSYPFSPLNIVLANYFTVGIPGLLISYWSVRSPRRVAPAQTTDFLRRIAPYPFVAGLLQAIGVCALCVYSLWYGDTTSLTTLLTLSFIGFGFAYFVLASSVIGTSMTHVQWNQLLWLAVVELTLLMCVFLIPLLGSFFSITLVSLLDVSALIFVVTVVSGGIYALSKFSRIVSVAH